MIDNIKDEGHQLAKQPSFCIGKMAVFGNLVLAPMDGFSDSPFRKIARQHGAALCFTEFINVIDIVHGHPKLEERLKYIDEEKPIGFQIFDNDPERILRAANILVAEWQPDFIDINLGCSDRRVTARGAGASLLKTPAKIATIFDLLSKNIEIPITAKIRLGWDEHQKNYLDILHIIEDNNGKAITVHARTKTQGLSGKADWDAIAEIKNCASIPVIGNGDILDLKDITKMQSQTGCDAIMIGRGALGNPWIFSKQGNQNLNPDVIKSTILRHLQFSLDFYGQEGIIRFRKHLNYYLKHFDISPIIRNKFVTSTDQAEIMTLLQEI